MKIPTLGSMPGLVPDEPMLRMITDVLRLLLAWMMFRLGTSLARSAMLVMLAFSS
jgi:hypothetical protein